MVRGACWEAWDVEYGGWPALKGLEGANGVARRARADGRHMTNGETGPGKRG